MYLCLRGDCEVWRQESWSECWAVGQQQTEEREGSNGRMPFAILATHRTPPWHCFGKIIELEIHVREDFTITEMAPTMAFSW